MPSEGIWHQFPTDYYPTATPPYTKVTINNYLTNPKWTKTYMDGFGRAIKVEAGYGSTTVSTVETEYAACSCSPLSKVWRTTRPYAPAGTKYWTTNTYDALGRTVSVALPSSMGTTAYVYEGNTVKVTDPAGKWKKHVMDAMGQMTQVIEPNPAGGNLTTDYTYNRAGQLTRTQQVRGGVTQNRDFAFSNTTGLMSSSTAPETGAASFTYNADYSLDYKVDAKNQKIKYTYDSLKRVTRIARHPVSSGAEDVCQRAEFSYDTNPHDGSYSTNISGRLAAVRWGDNGGTACTAQGGRWTEMYKYSSAGLVLGKRLDVYRGVNTQTFSTTHTYNSEGQLTATTYPLGGSSKSYDYDSFGRLTTLRETNNSATYASGGTYNAAGQLTQFTYGPSAGWTETNTYNILGQLTERAIPSLVDWTYTFSSTANNGQIEKQKDVITGEEVNYTYDALQRLLTAQTTGPDWGLSFGYDGFGNKLSQTVTKGTAPASSITVNSNNQVTGQTYDANGNLTVGASSTLTYDVDNRVLTATGLSSEWYGYSPNSKRVWKKRLVSGSTYEELVYFYGPVGKMGSYTLTDTSGTLSAAVKDTYLYFGGQMIKEGTRWLVQDRLGSVKYRHDGTTGERNDYWPYGEEKSSATAQGREKFATYERDATGLDYADQRYFTDTSGRFVTPDPAGDGMNWYAYAGGDPINRSDPSGLLYSLTVGGQTFIDETEFGLMAGQLFCDLTGGEIPGMWACGPESRYASMTGEVAYVVPVWFDAVIGQAPAGAGTTVASEQEVFETINNNFQGRGRAGIDSFSAECNSYLDSRGLSTADWKFKIGQMSFYNGVANSGQLLSSIGVDLPGTLGDALGNNVAVTLVNSNGTPTNRVILGSAFYNGTSGFGNSIETGQMVTIIHEALHNLYFGQSHVDIAAKLGLNSNGWSEAQANHAISRFIGECMNAQP